MSFICTVHVHYPYTVETVNPQDGSVAHTIARCCRVLFLSLAILPPPLSRVRENSSSEEIDSPIPLVCGVHSDVLHAGVGGET